MKRRLIHNDHAGSAAGLSEQLVRFANRCQLQMPSVENSASVPEQVHRALAEGVDQIVVVGGDGTVSQVVDSLRPDFSRVQLALIPAGTGNDLSRSLALPIDDFEAACALAMEGNAVPIDVVKFCNDSPFYFVNVANGGIGGQVAMDVDPLQKQRWGAFAYWLTSLSQLIEPVDYEVEIELEDERFDTNVYGIAVANGRYVGGGFPIAPDAVLDDGLLDVTLLSVPLAADLLSLGLRSVVETHASAIRRARRVVIRANPPIPFSVDGEPERATDATFEVIPRALHIVVGDGAAIASNCHPPRQTVA